MSRSYNSFSTGCSPGLSLIPTGTNSAGGKQGHVLQQSEVPCPSACRCDDGFIYCNDRGLSIIPPLPLTAAVLYLQNNRIDNAGLPVSLERRMTVRVVYLYDNELDDFPTHLPPSLRELHLQDNNIRTLPRAALARLPLLEKLHMDDNSISTVSIEEKAFANNPRLRLLFLSRNHLSSIPSGLPSSLEELRLDDNRISTIPTHAFRGLASLRRLFLDGNLLANQRIADDTFSRLSNLTELSLVRNSLQSPPLNLPSTHLLRLYLQDNAMVHMPRSSLEGMRRLQKLDLSGNNLTTLPRGLFRDLDSISQLLLRGNPWYCGCNLRWLHDWLHVRGSSVTVRGLTCHGPEKARGKTLRDLTSGGLGGSDGAKRDQGDFPTNTPTTTTPPLPQGSLFTLRSRRPVHRYPDLGQDGSVVGADGVTGKSLVISVKPLTPETVHITWQAAQPASAFRLSWLRLGNNPAMGSITETLVPGDRREYLLTQLQPHSSYIICLVPLVHEHPACARTETAYPQLQPGYLTADDHTVYGRDVVASRSSGSIMMTTSNLVQLRTTQSSEIGTHGFQMTPLAAHHPLQPKAKVEDMTYIHTIFPSNNTTLYRSTLNHTANPGYGTNRGYREGGIPDIDYAYT
uniref:Fibronectin type-III domain-containing protein n=1 Tax=Electrophorus electricus TaxID=8005 RepID=A0AAY5EC97_ELEEL